MLRVENMDKGLERGLAFECKLSFSAWLCLPRKRASVGCQQCQETKVLVPH